MDIAIGVSLSTLIGIVLSIGYVDLKFDCMVEGSHKNNSVVPRASLGHVGKARFAGDGRSLAKKRNAADGSRDDRIPELIFARALSSVRPETT
jgi:hypothetical protein